MLNADIDAFRQDLSSVALVHDHTERVCCHIVDATRFAVVRFERHTFVDGAMTLELKDNE